MQTSLQPQKSCSDPDLLSLTGSGLCQLFLCCSFKQLFKLMLLRKKSKKKKKNQPEKACKAWWGLAQSRLDSLLWSVTGSQLRDEAPRHRALRSWRAPCPIYPTLPCVPSPSQCLSWDPADLYHCTQTAFAVPHMLAGASTHAHKHACTDTRTLKRVHANRNCSSSLQPLCRHHTSLHRPHTHTHIDTPMPNKLLFHPLHPHILQHPPYALLSQPHTCGQTCRGGTDTPPKHLQLYQCSWWSQPHGNPPHPKTHS